MEWENTNIDSESRELIGLHGKKSLRKYLLRAKPEITKNIVTIPLPAYKQRMIGS
jgi:hypothetical protein